MQILQGHWEAISPKPTTLLFVAPEVSGATILQWLNAHKTRDNLPPLPMGRLGTPEGGFSTAQLKRYPEALCVALASVAKQLMPYIEQPIEANSIDWVDPVYQAAATLRNAYLDSVMNADDGADFHKFNVAAKLGAPTPQCEGWVKQLTLNAIRKKESGGFKYFLFSSWSLRKWSN